MPYESVLRRITPTPDQDAYECLYFWVCHRDPRHHDIDYEVKIEDLEEIKGMLGENISIHYRDTIDLLRRCNKRQKFTDKVLNRNACRYASGIENDYEVRELIDNCNWYRVYDVAEKICQKMLETPYSYNPEKFKPS